MHMYVCTYRYRGRENKPIIKRLAVSNANIDWEFFNIIIIGLAAVHTIQYNNQVISSIVEIFKIKRKTKKKPKKKKDKYDEKNTKFHFNMTTITFIITITIEVKILFALYASKRAHSHVREEEYKYDNVSVGKFCTLTKSLWIALPVYSIHPLNIFVNTHKCKHV